MPSLADLVNSKTTVTIPVNGFELVLPITLSPAKIDIATGYLRGLTPKLIADELNNYRRKSRETANVTASEIGKIIYTGDDPKGWLVLVKQGVMEIVSFGRCGYVQKTGELNATGASQAL